MQKNLCNSVSYYGKWAGIIAIVFMAQFTSLPVAGENQMTPLEVSYSYPIPKRNPTLPCPHVPSLDADGENYLCGEVERWPNQIPGGSDGYKGSNAEVRDNCARHGAG